MIYPSLLSILVSIVWIVFGTSRLKLNPFIVLLSASLLLGFLLKIPIVEIFILIKSGFLKIIENIGLLIVFGTIIGVILEKSNGTIVIASNVLKYFSRLPLPFAVSIIGYIVSIPVFCDAAFVILSRLNKTLANQTKTPLVGLTVALSTGLFAPHVLIPPTPGPLAAASNLDLKNIFLLIAVGSIIGFVLILVGAFYGNYLIKRNKYEGSESNKNILNKQIGNDHPKFISAMLPILLPIGLMSLGALVKFIPFKSLFLDFINLLTSPISALGVGLLFSLRLYKTKNKFFIIDSFKMGIKQALPILLITGMGGALGSIIQTIPIKDFALHLTDFKTLGILIPFGIAALLKTAQGSSTVAIITTSSICFPLLPLLELESDMGKVWTIMSLGVGSMTISHANDSYFWIVSQMGGLDVKTAYKTHTMGTLLQGVIGLGVVFFCYSLWTFLN